MYSVFLTSLPAGQWYLCDLFIVKTWSLGSYLYPVIPTSWRTIWLSSRCRERERGHTAPFIKCTVCGTRWVRLATVVSSQRRHPLKELVQLDVRCIHLAPWLLPTANWLATWSDIVMGYDEAARRVTTFFEFQRLWFYIPHRVCWLVAFSCVHFVPRLSTTASSYDNFILVLV